MTRVLQLPGLVLALSLASCADLKGPVEIPDPPVASTAYNHYPASDDSKAFIGG